MEEDRIYQEREAVRDFSFNEEVAAVFDNMIGRSVPQYRELLREEARILSGLLGKGELVYDLGCSTGNGLLAVAAATVSKRLRFIGVDSSRPMLRRARENAHAYRYGADVDFVEGDAASIPLELCGAVLCNYTLQFVRPLQRPEFLSRIFRALRPGGILLLAEKTVEQDPQINRIFIAQGHDFKKEQGYSDLEIARKREELENVLIPFSIDENQRILQEAGFARVAPFFQWFNFSAIVAIKGDGADAKG